jgi:hypothetical protein
MELNSLSRVFSFLRFQFSPRHSHDRMKQKTVLFWRINLRPEKAVSSRSSFGCSRVPYPVQSSALSFCEKPVYIMLNLDIGSREH